MIEPDQVVLKISRGDDYSFDLTSVDADGEPKDITGYTYWFTAKSRLGDSDAQAAIRCDNFTNEVKLLVIRATAGTLTLTRGDQTTDPLDFDIDAATLQAELEDLTTIGVGNVSVVQVTGGPYTITLGGDAAGLDIGPLVVDDSGLTGTAEILESKLSKVLTFDGATDGTLTLELEDEETDAVDFDGTADDWVTALEGHSLIAPETVSVVGEVGGPFSIVFDGSDTRLDVNSLAIGTSTLVGATPRIDSAVEGGGVRIIDSSAGTVRISIRRTDTEGLRADQKLHWDVQESDTDGNIRTLSFGILVLTRDITQRIS